MAVERSGRLYHILGVPLFKRVLMATLGRVLPLPNYRLEGGAKSLEGFERWTRVNESYHLILGAIMAGAVAWVIVRRQNLPLQLILLGCVLNLYLVLLHRYNRVRLYRALSRLQPKPKVRRSAARSGTNVSSAARRHSSASYLRLSQPFN